MVISLLMDKSLNFLHSRDVIFLQLIVVVFQVKKHEGVFRDLHQP